MRIVTRVTVVEAKRGHHPNIAIAIILTVQLMIIVDGTITNVALPVLRSELGFSRNDLAWIGNTFALAFGGLLLLAGRVGDVFGRRRVFALGSLAFAASSTICGVAQDPAVLLLGRSIQGVAAAFASSAAMALIISTFDEGPERAKAVTGYAGVSSIGGALGLVLGGFIVEYSSWRLAFFINIPLGIAAAALVPLYLNEPERHRGRFDIAGAVTSTLGMSALVFGFIQAASDGWSDKHTLRAFGLSLVGFIAFFHVERRAAQPLVPFGLFKDRTRSAAYITRFMILAAMTGSFFFMSQYLQEVRGYSPVQNGLALLPNTLALFGTAQIARRLLPRLGTRRTALIGLVTTTLGFALLTRLDTDSSFIFGIALPLTLTGLGIGFPSVALTLASMANVSQKDSGAAGGMLNVVQQLGSALGLSILVTVFGTAARSAASHPIAGQSAVEAGHRAFVHGLDAAFAGAVVFGLIAIAIVVGAIRPRAEGAISVLAPHSAPALID